MSNDIVELLTLHEVASLSFPKRYGDLVQEIIEKGSRLFGIRRLAIILEENGKQECIGQWGFRSNEEILEKIEKPGDKSFVYTMSHGVRGLIYLETSLRISLKEKKLYNIFARGIENMVALRRMEDKVKESEREKKAILDSINEMVVYHGRDQRILWANLSAAKYANRAPEEIKGCYCYEVLHQRKEPCPGCPVAIAGETGTAQEGLVMPQKDRHFYVRAYPLKNDDGSIEGVVEVSIDVTEKVQAEEMFRTVFDSVHDAIFIHDMDGNILDVNRTMLQLYDIDTKEEAVKYSVVSDYSSPDNPLSKLRGWWKEALDGETPRFDWKARRPGDGSVFDAEVCLKKITYCGKDAILATVRDISERKRQEQFLKNIFTLSPIGMYLVSRGKFIMVNAQFEKLTGYTREELLGMEAMSLVFPEDRDVVRRNAVKMLKGELSSPYAFRLVTKQGIIKWTEATVASLQHGGQMVALGNIIDVTEKKNAVEKLEYISLHDQLTGLHNRACFEEELKRLSASNKYPVTIIIADLDGLKLINDTFGHYKGDELLISCARVLKKALRSSDVLARIGGDEFAILLPCTGEEEATSILNRLRSSVDQHNQEHPELPLSVSFGIATAHNSEELLKEAYKKADDLMYREKLYRGSSARNKIVAALLAALSERDFMTEGHGRRLEKLSRMLGEKIGLLPQQLSNLSLLAQMHDIGKVGIPDNILFKEGPLTDKEWEIMRKHPEIGYRIALASPDLAGIADLILKHHEKWDGTGYPLGLKGEEIPIECRILAIVDAFDAMTSDRPYRKAKSLVEALSEIRSCAGKQFDPLLAEEFVRMIVH